MQKPFKDRSTQPDMAWYQFIEHFTLKVRCMAKTMQAFEEFRLLFKYAAGKTIYLGEIQYFQRQMFGKHCNVYKQFID